jgi:hypothetical protein
MSRHVPTAPRRTPPNTAARTAARARERTSSMRVKPEPLGYECPLRGPFTDDRRITRRLHGRASKVKFSCWSRFFQAIWTSQDLIFLSGSVFSSMVHCTGPKSGSSALSPWGPAGPAVLFQSPLASTKGWRDSDGRLGRPHARRQKRLGNRVPRPCDKTVAASKTSKSTNPLSRIFNARLHNGALAQKGST